MLVVGSISGRSTSAKMGVVSRGVEEAVGDEGASRAVLNKNGASSTSISLESLEARQGGGFGGVLMASAVSGIKSLVGSTTGIFLKKKRKS